MISFVAQKERYTLEMKVWLCSWHFQVILGLFSSGIKFQELMGKTSLYLM